MPVLLLLLVGGIILAVLFYAVSEEEMVLTGYIDLNVTSDTTLWFPGTHSFEMSGIAYLEEPFNETLDVQGTGIATYSCIDPPSPPCEFDVNINFTGDLSNTIINGPITVSAVGHGKTDLLSPTPGFIRTEGIEYLTLTGTYKLPVLPYNIDWNSTTNLARVDFSSISPDGKSFRLQVTGTTNVSLAEEPPEIPEFPHAILPFVAAALFAVAAYGRRPT